LLMEDICLSDGLSSLPLFEDFLYFKLIVSLVR
jgi:hypothetical protein